MPHRLTIPIFCLFLAIGRVTVPSLSTIESVDTLTPGMSTARVRTHLGTPASIDPQGNLAVWTYHLLTPHQKWIPYYLVFHNDGKGLHVSYTGLQRPAQHQHVSQPPVQVSVRTHQ